MHSSCKYISLMILIDLVLVHKNMIRSWHSSIKNHCQHRSKYLKEIRKRAFKKKTKALPYLRWLFMQVDEKQKSVLLSEQGYEDAEEILNVKDLYDPREQWASYILNAIKAKELFLRDVNYIIRGKDVLIVDEFTGRVMQVNLVLWLAN